MHTSMVHIHQMHTSHTCNLPHSRYAHIPHAITTHLHVCRCTCTHTICSLSLSVSLTHTHTHTHTHTEGVPHAFPGFPYLGRCSAQALSAGRPGVLAPAVPPVFLFLPPGSAGDLESLSRENGKIGLLCSCSTTWGAS